MTDFIVHFVIAMGVLLIGRAGRLPPTLEELLPLVIAAVCIATLIHIGFAERAKRDEVDGFFGG